MNAFLDASPPPQSSALPCWRRRPHLAAEPESAQALYDRGLPRPSRRAGSTRPVRRSHTELQAGPPARSPLHARRVRGPREGASSRPRRATTRPPPRSTTPRSLPEKQAKQGRAREAGAGRSGRPLAQGGRADAGPARGVAQGDAGDARWDAAAGRGDRRARDRRPGRARDHGPGARRAGDRDEGDPGAGGEEGVALEARQAKPAIEGAPIGGRTRAC